MKPKDLIQKITKSGKTKDYSLVIFFFLIFAVFVWFAIRPNIITAFSLQKELEELRERDQHYEEVILSIVDFQTKMESNRDNFYLLEESIPKDPYVHDIIHDIIRVASESSVTINRLDLKEVPIVSGNKDNKGTVNKDLHIKKYVLTMNSQTSQQKIENFVMKAVSQQRLKLFEEVVYSIETERGMQSTGSATYRVEFSINGLYL